MTDEARVLKEIRAERKQKFDGCSYSLRAVAERLCRTDAWLSQSENGRADMPTYHGLDALLSIYGLKRKSFMRGCVFTKRKHPQEVSYTS